MIRGVPGLERECYGALYIMDHEVVPCSFKTCDQPLNSSQDHGIKGLHKTNFQAYIVY